MDNLNDDGNGWSAISHLLWDYSDLMNPSMNVTANNLNDGFGNRVKYCYNHTLWFFKPINKCGE